MENEKMHSENRALKLIPGRNDFKYDSGASEKHFMFFIFGQLFKFLTGS